MSVNEKMTAIADAIRSKTGETEKLTLDAMAQAIPGIYDKGVGDGNDLFWDLFQNHGKRTAYNAAFVTSGFVHLDPKYPINATNADNMMSQSRQLESVNWEKFNLSNAGSLYSAFAHCDKLKRVDTALGISNGTATLMNSLARQSIGLESIQKIYAEPVYVWKQSFEGCTALTHVIFSGTIGANGLDLRWSAKLDKESLESIIETLSSETTGLSITLSKAAVENAFPPYIDGEDIYDNLDWISLINTKQNWTINLA